MRASPVLLAIFVAAPALSQNVNSVGLRPNSGQRELGSRLPAKPRDDSTIYTQEQASAAAYKLAQCFVRGSAPAAAAYLAEPADVGSPAGQKMGKQLEVCFASATKVASTMHLPADLLRGMLAEAMLARRSNVALPAAVAAKPSYAASWMTSDPSRRVVEEMGACLADTKPSQVRDVIATQPGSPEAQAALGAIMPFVGGCLAANTTLKTNALGLRSAMAEALYHREFDPPLVVPAPASTDAH